MQHLPFERKHIREGAHLFEENKIGQILFSSGTYQIEVFDPAYKEPLWPFLQLDGKGHLSDCFCSCAAEEFTHSCPHLVCAFLAIFRDKNYPLHIRFQHSLWNLCAQIAALRHGYETDVLKKEGNTYSASSETDKILFSIKPLNKEGGERLKEMIDNRVAETEETSLKFSNLPIEEIALWKAGRPSHFLKYELSFWSDLAKWWMVTQDKEEAYTIHFLQQDGEKLPKWMHVKFKSVEFRFYIAEANWHQIIPSLAFVNSPLAVYELPNETIKKITYDPLHKHLQLFTAPLLEKKEGVEMGEWFFVPHKGFYPLEADPLLKLKEVPENKIPTFFHRHYTVLEKYLKRDKTAPGIALSSV